MQSDLPLFTIGHSTRSIPDFVELLRRGPAQQVIDVRTVPRSRHNPQYNEDTLAAELDPYRIGYRRMADLGGLRGRAADIPPHVNGLWRNQSFHNYADYALSATFQDALRKLLEVSAEMPCAIMCAEAVWWRCHRRIIADYCLVRGRRVLHLLGTDRAEPAKLTLGAVPHDERITYPAVQDQDAGTTPPA